MRKISAVFIMCALASSASMAVAKSNKLGIVSSDAVDYQCADGTKVKVADYGLSDDSLSFVKFTLDEQAYTLPRVVSASGVRYTDLNRVEWFTKGDTASLNRDVTNDKSVPTGCKAVTPSKK